MELPEGLDLDEKQLRQEFKQLSASLAKAVEASHQAQEETDLHAVWARRRPTRSVRAAYEKMGLGRDDLDEYAAEADEVYQDYYQSELKPQLVDSTHPIDWVPEEREEEPAIEGATRATPYAVMAVSDDVALLEESFPGGEVHNPYAVRVEGSKRENFYMNFFGQGSGLVGLWPGHNNNRFYELYWFFLHVPIKPVFWFSTGRVWLHGSIRCWADDAPFLSSKYAEINMSVGMHLVPLGVPNTALGSKSSPSLWSPHSSHTVDQVIHYAGQNIDVARWGGWLPELQWLWPKPAHYTKPHWIIVSARGHCSYRGTSHTMLNFEKGYSSTGSYGTPSYKVDPYGIYVGDILAYEMTPFLQGVEV
ncbi:MAG: hypothetical protein R3335_05590 [Anaerolineales bacterium]|nr:hypothetical protein [Anaerolineales bacterium]